MNNQQQQTPPYLFFSPKCAHCLQLIELIKKNETLANKIQPVNIHDNLRNLPKDLQGVPAILYNGQLLHGPDTFKWVHFNFRLLQDSKNRENEGRGQAQGQSQGQSQGQGQMQGGDSGSPLPSDIMNDSIDYTPLSEGSQMDEPTIARYAFLPGENNSYRDGTEGIDINAASENISKNRGSGVDSNFKQLQQERENSQQQQQQQPSYQQQQSQQSQQQPSNFQRPPYY